MVNEPEQQEAHKNPETETETEVEETGEETTSQKLSDDEIAELKKKAEVSSQNFERAKKAEKEAKELADRIKELEEANLSETEFDTDKDLKKELSSLRDELNSFKRSELRKSLEAQYPALKDKKAEFDEYLEAEQDLPLDKAAKLFLAENGLLETKEKRKGLEKQTGGQREVKPSAMTAEDVKRLRETNYKKYLELVRAGKLKDIA